MSDSQDKTAFFAQLLLSVNSHLYVSTYDSTFQLLTTSCSDVETPSFLVHHGDEAEVCPQMFSVNSTPVILTDRFSTIYAIVKDSKNSTYVLLGPVYVSDETMDTTEKRIYDLHLAKEENGKILHFIHKIPIVDATKLMEYTLMLEKAVNDHNTSISDIRYTGNSTADLQKKNPLQEEAAYHGTYEGEQTMLRMVREGDIENFEKQMNQMVTTGTPGILANDRSRQLKNLVLVNIVLFSRAAIDGGLSSETALSLTDYYFQAVEGCRSLAALTEIAKTMQKDFVTRVHNCQINHTYSKPVQSCIQYIERHLEEPILLKDMANYLGYTGYYLSRRFKAETENSISEFIMQKRLKRAEFLLTNTKIPIHEISDRLQFNSQSYFTANFKKVYGIQPTTYRQKKQILK